MRFRQGLGRFLAARLVSPKGFPRWWYDVDFGLGIAVSVLVPGARPRRGCGGWRSGQLSPGRRAGCRIRV